MSGCFGGSAEDRYFENQLNKYLDKQADAELTDEERAELRDAKDRDDDAKYEAWEEAKEQTRSHMGRSKKVFK